MIRFSYGSIGALLTRGAADWSSRKVLRSVVSLVLAGTVALTTFAECLLTGAPQATRVSATTGVRRIEYLFINLVLSTA